MLEFLRTPIAQTVMWFSVLAGLVALGVFVVAKFRDRAVKNVPETGELLSSFREMQQHGDLSEAEFRTIKTKLGASLPEKVTDSGDTGREQSG